MSNGWDFPSRPSTRPLIVGHRGLKHPSISENTVAAMRAAYEAGADAVECDIRLGTDGEIFVCHNRYGVGTDEQAVESYTADERAALGIEPITTFLAELEQWPGKGLIIEAKNSAVMRMFCDGRMPDNRIMLISFSDAATRIALSHGWTAGQLAAGHSAELLLDLAPEGARFSPQWDMAFGLSPSEIAVANAWTVNDLSVAQTLAQMGIWAITTDYPSEMLHLFVDQPTAPLMSFAEEPETVVANNVISEAEQQITTAGEAGQNALEEIKEALRGVPAQSLELPVGHEPIIFQPLFMDRVWGGRHLHTTLGKALPAGHTVGESWEFVDRPDEQSISISPGTTGLSLHELWTQHRALFGTRGLQSSSERFPLLIKVLDACEDLSVQVHPPAAIASELGGEPKTEMWVMLDTWGDSSVYAGLVDGVTETQFQQALENGDNVIELLHRIETNPDDAIFLPSGRVHAIGGGNLIVEIQQNSDTTYRVYDFDRPGLDGNPRELHVEQSMRSIDWNDHEPELIEPAGEILVQNEILHVEQWELHDSRQAIEDGECAVVCCLHGSVEIRGSGVVLHPGEFAFIAATSQHQAVQPGSPDTSMLRIMLPA